ncbi:MAG: glycosyltransferase family 9 protein, partial [Mariprofundales bacterium]|nr:glycosyltransferase family 9 protein [Mariprofundales bacterium]
MVAVHHLVIHPPNWLGDVVMAQPAMRAFVTALQPQRVTLVGRVWLQELAPWLDLGEVECASTIPTDGDAVVLLPNSIRVAWEAWRAGVASRIGFRGQWRRPLLTYAPKPRHDMMRAHHRDYFLDLAEQYGIACGGSRVHLAIPAGAVERGVALLRQHGLDAARTVAIAPGAQFGGAKRYPALRYREVAEGLTADGWQVVTIGTAAERAICDSVVDGAAIGWSSAGVTTLTQALELIAASRLLLCNDSGMMHVAAGIGRAVVALFGATDPQRTAPDGAEVQLIYHP